jgi:hypothetical protein
MATMPRAMTNFRTEDVMRSPSEVELADFRASYQ